MGEVVGVRFDSGRMMMGGVDGNSRGRGRDVKGGGLIVEEVLRGRKESGYQRQAR